MTKTLVAVIEDNVKVRQGLSQILELQGYKPQLFDNAEEFLQLADPDQFCAILLDQNLGEEQMTGLQLLKRFHQQNVSTPVLMMSGEATIDVGFAANQLGVFRCLPKPVGFEALGRALEEMRTERESRRVKGGASVTDQEREGLRRLTPAEVEVMKLVAQGFSTAEIAEKQGKSEKTVSSQRASIGSKLGTTKEVRWLLTLQAEGMDCRS